MAAVFEVDSALEVAFEGTRFDGAVVKMRLDMPLAESMEIQRELIERKTLAEQAPVFGEKLLVDWNLQYKGAPIPATAEGATQAPGALVLACIEQWFKAVVDPKVPLSGKRSST